MGEGERQDDIAVTKIDDTTRTITFNNHGVVQELGLTDVKLTAPAAPVGGPGGPGMAPGGIPMPAAAPGVASAGLIGRGVKGRGVAGADAAANPSANVANATKTADPAHASDNLTPEERAILIEAQRGVWKEQGNPAAAILPPTTSILGKQVVDELHGESPKTPAAPSP